MKRVIGGLCAAFLLAGLAMPARADDAKDAKAILDKAIKALGGEAKLGALKAASWKTKGKLTFDGNDSNFTIQATQQGLDRTRQEFEGEFGGMKVKGVTVLNGNKGWRKFGDMNMEMDKEGIANEKRTLYLQLIPVTILPLNQKAFKIALAGEEKVGGKTALGIKVTGPDGKDFKLYFDKESGLPVKQVAKVTGFMGDEFTQDTTFGDYKDFDGIKKATKIVSKRDGEKFLEQTITEFKVLKKVDDKLFKEPK